MGDNIMAYNGGSVIAMAGKNCVAIATDLRHGVQNHTIGFDYPKVFRVTEHAFVGLPGLLTDTQTLYVALTQLRVSSSLTSALAPRFSHDNLKFRIKMYSLRENREMKPQVVAHLCESMLYEHRFGPFFVEPVIAGLENGTTPYLCAMDLIGAPLKTQDFVLAGTSSQAMFGLAETLWKPDLDSEQLFEVISQVMLNAVDRDALAGWGARVFVLTPNNLIIKDLKARQD